MGNREDKSLHLASCMAAKFLDLNKPWSCKYGRKKNEKKLTCMTFLCMIALRNKTVAHTKVLSILRQCKWHH